MKIAVITDSAANLAEEFIKLHKNLFVVPLMISVDGVEYRDQKEISAQEVYEKLDESSISTSLPSNEDLIATLIEIKSQGFTHVIVVNISSGLSGTFNSFRLVLEKEKELKIIHYDSKTLGGGLGFLVEYTLELIKKNIPFDSYVELLDELRYQNSIAFYTINTLKYLRKGGRIGKVEGTLGEILHIKPIITVNDEGVYVTMSKALGLKRALITMKNILLEKFGTGLVDLIIHFGIDEEHAQTLGEKLKNVLNIRNLRYMRLTPVLGVHTGPDMFAYVARKVNV